MGSPRRYPAELKERAVRSVLAWRLARGRVDGGIKELAEQFGVHPESLRSWLKQMQVDGETRERRTTDDKARIAELERELRDLRRADEVVKPEVASRAMSTLAPRLATLEGANIAILRNKKLGSETVADTVAEGLPQCEARHWVKPSPYSPLSPKMYREIAAWADGVVACPGDCAHGSSVLRFDIFALEAAGVPVAWIDTPGRMPVVKRSGRVFEIDYNIPGGRRAPVRRIEAAGRALAVKTFEKWGLHRALRVAGAKAGDTVRVGGLEAELWDYPPKLLEGWDGPAEFAYVEIPSLRRTRDVVLRGWIRERMPDVQRLLLQ